MDVGIFAGSSRRLDRVIDQARLAAADGFGSFWLPQVAGLDALTAIAVIGREVERIELGTAVVPIQPRHPQALVSQALTVQAAIGNRLVLGIGLSHQFVVEHLWGLPWDRPVRRMREYLDVLLPMMKGEHVELRSETVTAVGSVAVADAEPPAVLIAALGPQMLALAGSRAAGTVTWCKGPQTLATHIVPSITAAAEAAGRPEPRIVAALPICLTDDIEGARRTVAERLAGYGQLPSYRAMLDREGAADPADIAIVGDEDAAFEVVEDLRGAGVTDFVAAEMTRTPDEAERTRVFLRSLL